MSKKKHLILFASLILIMGLTVMATVLYIAGTENPLEEERQNLLTEFDQLELLVLKREKLLQDSMPKDYGSADRIDKELNKITGLIKRDREKLQEMQEDWNIGILKLLRGNTVRYQSRLEHVSATLYKKSQSIQDTTAQYVVEDEDEDRLPSEFTAKGITSKARQLERVLSESQQELDSKNREISIYSQAIGDKETELSNLKAEVKDLLRELSAYKEYRVFDFEKSFRMSAWVNTGSKNFASYELGPRGKGPKGLEYIKIEFLTPNDNFKESDYKVFIYDNDGHKRVEYEGGKIKDRWVYGKVPVQNKLKPGRHFIKVKVGDHIIFNRRFIIDKTARS